MHKAFEVLVPKFKKKKSAHF